MTAVAVLAAEIPVQFKHLGELQPGTAARDAAFLYGLYWAGIGLNGRSTSMYTF